MSRRSVAMLIAILAVAAAIRIHLFRGYIGLDDGEYAYLANQFAQGSFVRADYAGPAVFPLRVGIVAPAAVLFRRFGVSERTLAVYPLMLSLSGIALVYFCASLFFEERAGLIAATLLAVFPADIETSTQLLADLPAAFYATVAITLIAYLERSGVQRRSALFTGGVLSGLAFGLAWLCKESVSYVAPLCIIWMALGLRKDGRRTALVWSGVAVGSLAILIGEMVTYQNLTGDLLFRFHEIERNYHQNEKYFFTEGSQFGWETGADYRHALVNRLLVNGPAVIFLNRTYLFLPLVGVAATIYAGVRRERAFIIPALWLWSLALMFNFSSSSMTSYVPLALFNRYLYPLFYPAVVLAAGFFAATLLPQAQTDSEPAAVLRRWAVALVAAVILGFGGLDLLRALKHPPSWLSEIRSVRPLVKPETILYTDTLSLRAFEFLAAYPKRTEWVDFKDVSSPTEMAPGSLVVVNRPSIAWLDKHGGIWGSARSGYRRHDFYGSPPRSWTPVRQSSRLSVYLIPDVAATNGR